MLVVVVWHVTIIWPFAVQLSDSTNTALEWLLSLTRWTVALFFLLSGFFGATLYARWGGRRFARDRLRRVALPLLVGILVLLPPTAWLVDRLVPGAPVRGGLMHLWFLYYVLLFYATVPLLAGSAAGAWLGRQLGKLLRSPAAVPVLAAVTAIIQYRR